MQPPGGRNWYLIYPNSLVSKQRDLKSFIRIINLGLNCAFNELNRACCI